MEEEVLNAVFRFKHKAPTDRQDARSCMDLIQHFTEFIKNLTAVKVENHVCGRVETLMDNRVIPISDFAVHEHDALKEVCRRLSTSETDQHKRGDVWYDPWLPMYGCAIQRTMLSATKVKLEVIFIDGWERTLHFLPSGECVHGSVPKAFHILHCARLDTDLVETFETAFEAELLRAQQRTKSERSAATNELGHQKTPQFIAALVCRAVAEVTGISEKRSVTARGGTTDVGQHTGGRPRDTCWALVQAAIEHNLCCGNGLFRKTMARYQLSLLESEVDFFDEDEWFHVKEGCNAVDDMFFMLQVVIQNLVELLENGYDVSGLQDQCKILRSSIDGFVDTLNRQTATRYVLPEAETLEKLEKLSCGVEIPSPKREKDSNRNETKEERQNRARLSLEASQFIDGASCTLENLLKWEETQEIPDSYKCILVMRTIEAFLFARSHELTSTATLERDNAYLEQMQSLASVYQKTASEWRRLPRLTSVLDVEQRSREMLVMSIIFCLVHQSCAAEVPLCAEYNIALNWKDLKVATLSDKAAITSLQTVTQYIRDWNDKTKGPSLFQLSDQGPTFDFGRKFVESSSIKTVYDREVKVWDTHVLSQWNEIEKKKKEAANLRAAISSLNQSLRVQQNTLSGEEDRLWQQFPYRNQWRCRNSPLKAQLQMEIQQLNYSIQHSEATLNQTIAVNYYMVRPLPPTKDDAYKVLFMLLMPRDIEIMGNLCLTAQRTLAPVEATPEMLELPKLSGTTWQEFHSQYAPSCEGYATSKLFRACPAEFTLPSTFGANTVDALSSLSDYKSECIWNPTFLGATLTWKDAAGVDMNPFNVTSASVINSFTEKMPESCRHLQWTNAWPGADDTRGNLVYANLHQQPQDFEKTSFIALGSLRAFPNQQFRKLQWAILDDVLPWSNPCVEITVRQSLYQVGDLIDETKPQLLWKTDMLQSENGLDTFCTTLKVTAEKLEQTPRRFECISLLSELAGYAHQFTDDGNDIVKLFAKMARCWASHVEKEYNSESSPELIASMRQRECILYGYALLAYTLGPWDNEAAQEVCELIVQFRTSFLCASINVAATNEMLRVESRVTEMMTRRFAELVAYVEKRGVDTMLTALVRLVSSTCPRDLKWKRVCQLNDEQFGSCFEDSGAHYAINLFTGVVLTDGNAPGGLPVHIRQHERFLALFGRYNFEVVFLDGVLRTQRQYCDRLYDFALQADEELLVQELTTNSAGVVTRTFQLCSVKWLQIFSSLFPARLRELYSHWYWVEKGCVLFRPTEAKCREVFFVAIPDESGCAQCFKVPFGDWKLPYEKILGNLDTYDRFIQKEHTLESALDIVAKFEDKQFLHPLKSPENIMKIELPRFKLTFWMNSNVRFVSEEHKGYVLAAKQQLDDFLPRFSRYLVLELEDKADKSRPEFRLLLPVGSVKEVSDGMVDVTIPIEAGKLVDVACYDVHRRLKTFETETIGARLQLAAVYCRAGTSLPSKRLKMTGAEAAVQMLRSCRSSRPFSTFEKDTLLAICKLSYREPAVKIVAIALLEEADRLAFLYEEAKMVHTTMLGADEKSEYADMCAMEIQRNPLRSQLQSIEENLIVGYVQHAPACVSSGATIMLESLPDDDYVRTTEAKLQRLLTYTDVKTKETPELMLRTSSTNAMIRDMLKELKRSWDCHHSQAHAKLEVSTDTLVKIFTTLLAEVSTRRQKVEAYLKSCFMKATGSKRDQLLAVANFLPLMTISDMVCCGFDDEILQRLMPKLSAGTREIFKKSVLHFMELCVLEDKIARLVWKASRRDELSDAQLIDDLVNVRQWKSAEFPYWLAFEVEGRLQIRHEQFIVAQHLIKKPGTVCQLNMGRGKTRVILPMLFLHFTRSRDRRVVRAHFLGPLLSEARQYMHRYLSASNAHLRVFEQPFHRQIGVDVRRLELIRDSLEEMKLFGGIQMVAPEHRMSLELKRMELEGDKPTTELLDEILDNNQFVDLLDECDALLHHKYHLVYAVGTPIPLCSGIERWQATEAVLRVMMNKSPGSRVAKVLQAPHVSCSSPDYATRLGAYDGTRLNTIVKSTEKLREQLRKDMVLDLIDNAPFEMMWLSTFGNGAARNSLVKALTDSTVSLQRALGVHTHKFSSYIDQLLALRGLLAFGVLEHCLEKRHRVDFGLPVPGTRPKKIAIPFRAADVPSERSEFSHPDVCIGLTLLGYYHAGLTDEEVRIGFSMLLRLDISEQQQRYNQWFVRVEEGLSNEDRKTLCDVRHISLDDGRQLATLRRVYRFCTEAINFYLNTCVFPNDTQQYPQRLSRTAWNLAAGNSNIGFSGTNDNHRLLPLSVTQREPDEPSLLGTNGSMLDKILHVTQSYEVVRPHPDRSPIPWQSVLLFAMDKRAQALIDTGALLAGVMNHEAAEFVLQQSDFRFAGVTYFDSRKEFNCWMVAEKHRRLVMPLKSASMLERETFVIFDEARSRGSDMKLLSDASAVLTLGPKITKDKLMQGAGRMRQLGCNQTLSMASFDEVAQSIFQTNAHREDSNLTTIDVLNWVMDNTKAESVRGLLEWAGNGCHFRKIQRDQDAELIDENWSLEVLYEEKLQPQLIGHLIEAKARLGFKSIDDDAASEICRRGRKYGLDDEVHVTSHTDECERELQVEEEVQKEQEVEVATCSPAQEKAWNYSAIIKAQSVEDLGGLVQVVSIEDFIRKRVYPKNLADLAWTAANIFGTENFFSTILARENVDHLNDFLRVIDAALVFNNGEVLLVSECEADHILALLWTSRSASTSCCFCFVNLAFACGSIDRVGKQTQFQDVPLALGSYLNRHLPMLSIVACHVYSGETMLSKRYEAVVEPAFRELLRPLVQRDATLSNFVKSRGNSHKWTRSFLHQLCCRMDLESCE